MNEPLILTQKQAIAYVGVGRNTFLRWRKAGLIPRLDIEGRYHWYSRKDLEMFVAELERTR